MGSRHQFRLCRGHFIDDLGDTRISVQDFPDLTWKIEELADERVFVPFRERFGILSICSTVFFCFSSPSFNLMLVQVASESDSPLCLE